MKNKLIMAIIVFTLVGCSTNEVTSNKSANIERSKHIGDESSLAKGKRACSEGSSVSCFYLGLKYEEGIEVKQDYVMANRFYGKACDDGLSISCYNLGNNFQNAKGLAQSSFMANKYYKKACDAGIAKGCTNLGINLYKGLGIGQDIIKAKKFFRLACDKGDSSGCTYYKY